MALDWDAIAEEAHALSEGGSGQDPFPEAVDVTDWRAHASGTGEQEFVVRDLMPKGQVLVITGEEGDGKTLLAEQGLRQLLRREAVWGCFDPGGLDVTGVLFVDTEMTTDDAWPRWKEAEERGLAVPPGTLHWTCCGPINLGGSDQAHIIAELERTGANILWIDAGGSATEDPKDDLAVKALFGFLQRLIQSGRILGAGLTLHPRKRAQGEHSRRFDDLFGSREWKGKASKVIYIEGTKVVVWKDRGGHLGRQWTARAQGRFPTATLHRPGLENTTCPPFWVEAKQPEPAFDAEAARERALELVEKKPAHYAKTALAVALGGRKEDAVAVISALIAEGVLGPDKDRAKLSQIDGGLLG